MKLDPQATRFIAEQGKELASVLRAARAMIRRVVPDAEESFKPGWRAVGYRRNDLFCVLYPYRSAIKLAFERGQDLDDPDGLLQQTGKRMKFVLLKSPSDVSASVQGLVVQAAKGA